MRPKEFAQKAGLNFKKEHLLRRALTHRSFVNENPDALEDNERLEYLGDALLDFLIAAWLYEHFPEMDEGELTRFRSALVRTEQLATLAEWLGLGEALLLGHGEEASGGRERPAMLCAAFEALIGAIYVDSGWNTVVAFMRPRLEKAVNLVLEDETLLDARSQLQMWAQAETGDTPVYKTVEVDGPDHERNYVVEVHIGENLLGRGDGPSKQKAAQRAAEEALKSIGRPYASVKHG